MSQAQAGASVYTAPSAAAATSGMVKLEPGTVRAVLEPESLPFVEVLLTFRLQAHWDTAWHTSSHACCVLMCDILCDILC